jgi:predicted ATPase/DNA-binding XRE family transcriptional regulator
VLSARPYREFGSWLRSRRLARRWTQEELAQQLNYSLTYVRKIEWGERRPSEALRVRLAQVLGLPVSGLPPSVPNPPLPSFPDAPGPLIGRSDEVDAVLALFQRGERLVTIVGAPGIGKTRLALALASHLDGRLSGGARFVSLLDVSEDDGIAHPIARALGIVVPPGEEAHSRLIDALAAQEVLLVLDNFDHVLAGADLVGDLLARVPTLRALATSREALGLRSETLYVLPPLALPVSLAGPPGELARVASVELFVASARKVQPDFTLTAANVEAVADICARLQGIPLAIELAAGATRMLGPHALLAQMGHGLELPVVGPRDAPDHHRTLRAAINWSVARLSASEKTLLGRLAVFAGGCTISAAAAVCRFPGEDALDPDGGVLGLAGKSLLEPVPGVGEARFVALEAVRQLSLELLSASRDTDRVKRRHAEWVLELAEQQEDRLTGTGQAQALTVLEIEHANLRAALGWSVAQAPAVATRLCGALWRYWWMRGHLEEGREWLRLALAGPQSDVAAQARAMTGAGILARAQGAYAVGGQSLERAAELWRSIGDQGGLALSKINLGILAADQADHQRASALFEESRSLSGAIGDLRGVGHSLNCLGSVRLNQGDLEASSQLLEEALAIFRDVDDDWSTAMALANLGWVAYKQGRRPIARLLYEKAMAMYRVLGDERGVASMLLNLGIADGDDAAGVVGLFEEALLIFSRLGERRSVAECLDSLAVATAAFDPETTAVLLAASDTILSDMGAARWPDEQAVHDRACQAIRSALGEAAFELAWEDGRRMRLEQVVARRRPPLTENLSLP